MNLWLPLNPLPTISYNSCLYMCSPHSTVKSLRAGTKIFLYTIRELDAFHMSPQTHSLTWSNKHLLSHSLCDSGIWAEFSPVLLAQGLSWGCGRGVSQGYTQLNEGLPGLEDVLLSFFSQLLAGSLSSWPFRVSSQGSPQHVSLSDSPQREWFQRPTARDAILLLWSHLQVTHYHPTFLSLSEVN